MEGKDFMNTLRGNGVNHPPPVFKRKSESFKWMILVVIGVLLIFAGGIWVSLASWTPPPKASDFSNYHDYTKALQDWGNFTRSGNLYGRIVMEFGSLIMSIVSFLAYVHPAIDPEEKRIFIIMAIIGILVLVLISVGIIVNSPYSS